MNVGIFAGNLGRDSELQTTSKDVVLNFSIGVNVGTKTEPETMWVSCALWGKRGEALAPYLKKGSKVSVSGLVKLRTYQKKDGGQGAEINVSVQNIDLMGSSEPKPAGEPAKADGYQPQPKPAAANPGEFADMDDDIPF